MGAWVKKMVPRSRLPAGTGDDHARNPTKKTHCPARPPFPGIFAWRPAQQCAFPKRSSSMGSAIIKSTKAGVRSKHARPSGT